MPILIQKGRDLMPPVGAGSATLKVLIRLGRTVMHPIKTARSYLQAAPHIIRLQALSKTILALMLVVLDHVAKWALAAEGRVAVTTGDFGFLFTSLPGLFLVVLALVTLYVYVAADINVMIAFAGHWVRGDAISLRKILREGVSSLKSFMCWDGLLVVLYIALLAPILGVGASISLTENLQIPTFISSVIDATPLYHTAFTAFVVVFTIVGYLGSFIVYGVVLDGMTARASLRQSYQLVRQHWKGYLAENLRFFTLCVLVSVLSLVAAGILLIVVSFVISTAYAFIFPSAGTAEVLRFITLLFFLVFALIVLLVTFLASAFAFIKMTKLYLAYTTGEEVKMPLRDSRLALDIVLPGVGIAALCLIASCAGTLFFDDLFPQESSVQVIAHRACGNEGPENTAEGLAAAEAAGAWGAEIDIQRTSDGAYVVNHDGDFKRVAGDARKPSEMTLAEIRKLQVHANPADPDAPGVPVSTYEEMLDGAREHHLVLFVELKGETADHQMADDAVRIAREHDMLDQCVFISLGYELIDYLETTYPEVKTGFLAFASYGNTAALNCDYLALEELAATTDAISAIHKQGKGALVWTVNDGESQHRFLCSGADAIITDNMTQAKEIRATLSQRDDAERVIDGLAGLL